MIFTFLLFLFLFIINIFGVSHSVYGGDSGDIILASWFGGVAHPPGYPINTMIGWVFTHLPYSASVAYKANIMAAFFMAASASLLFLTLEKITKIFYASLSAVLILSFTPLFWLYAHVLEVFQLNLVLASLSLYFLVCWRESVLLKASRDLYLRLTFLFLGLCVFHHQTSMLLVPAFLYLILKTDKKIVKNHNLIFKLVVFFCLGVLPYIFIPLAALRKTPINWDDPSNLQNFFRLITRADYGTFTATAQLYGTALKARLFQIFNFLIFMKSDFSVLGSLFLILGVIYTFLKQREIFWFVFISTFLSGLFFLFYASFPIVNDFNFGLWERFMLLPYFFVTIYLAFGLTTFYEFTTRLFQKRIKVSKSILNLFVGGLLLLLPLYFIGVNWAKADLSNFYLGDWLGRDALSSVEGNAIVLLYNDTLTFNTQYIYYTNENVANIKIILAGQLRHIEYRQQVMRFYKELKYPDDFLDKDESDSSRYTISLLNANIDKFPIYSTDYFPKYDDYVWTTVGLVKKLVKKADWSKELLANSNDFVYARFMYKDFGASVGYSQYMTSHIQEIYYRSLIFLVDEMLENDMEKEALNYLNKAVVSLPDTQDAYIRLGNIAIKKQDCSAARENFEKAFVIDNKNWRLAENISGIYSVCLGDEAEASRYRDIANELKKKSNSPDII